MPFASNKDRHEQIGEGEIGIDAFRALLNDTRLSGLPGVLETEKDPDGDYDRKNLELLRSLVEM
jgi:deoxyribonuclease-4